MITPLKYWFNDVLLVSNSSIGFQHTTFHIGLGEIQRLHPGHKDSFTMYKR